MSSFPSFGFPSFGFPSFGFPSFGFPSLGFSSLDFSPQRQDSVTGDGKAGSSPGVPPDSE
jgi:hypothetical protein